MRRFGQIFGDDARTLLRRLAGVYLLLLSMNVAAWAWALEVFRDRPVLLGTALLAYTFGLRHAIDADHIAAIDNVTRRAMQGGHRPVGIGLFFSLGHSTVVVLASVGVALAATGIGTRLHAAQLVGGVAGTLISAGFLLAIALINLTILGGIWRSFRHVRRGGRYVSEDLDMLLAGGGILARIFRPLFRMVTRSWHMYPLGVLFGLGFDTATEIGLLGLSASEASRGLHVWSILVFPALFTAGMTLIDTTDSVLMLGAYGWAFIKPIRKLYYNLTITAVSVLVALAVGGIEVLGLIGDQLAMKGVFWDAVGSLNDNFGVLGLAIIGLFAASWIVSALVYRWKRYDAIVVEES